MKWIREAGQKRDDLDSNLEVAATAGARQTAPEAGRVGAAAGSRARRDSLQTKQPQSISWSVFGEQRARRKGKRLTAARMCAGCRRTDSARGRAVMQPEASTTPDQRRKSFEMQTGFKQEDAGLTLRPVGHRPCALAAPEAAASASKSHGPARQQSKPVSRIAERGYGWCGPCVQRWSPSEAGRDPQERQPQPTWSTKAIQTRTHQHAHTTRDVIAGESTASTNKTAADGSYLVEIESARARDALESLGAAQRSVSVRLRICSSDNTAYGSCVAA